MGHHHQSAAFPPPPPPPPMSQHPLVASNIPTHIMPMPPVYPYLSMVLPAAMEHRQPAPQSEALNFKPPSYENHMKTHHPRLILPPYKEPTAESPTGESKDGAYAPPTPSPPHHSTTDLLDLQARFQPKRPKQVPFPKKAGDARSRPYQCTFPGCDKSYLKSSHLASHVRSHTGDRPYVCDFEGCLWRFPRADELVRHQRFGSQLLVV